MVSVPPAAFSSSPPAAGAAAAGALLAAAEDAGAALEAAAEGDATVDGAAFVQEVAAAPPDAPADALLVVLPDSEQPVTASATVAIPATTRPSLRNLIDLPILSGSLGVRGASRIGQWVKILLRKSFARALVGL